MEKRVENLLSKMSVEEKVAQVSAYNSVDGIPASCNGTLLNDILKKEWGFKGIVVSDYDAVRFA